MIVNAARTPTFALLIFAPCPKCTARTVERAGSWERKGNATMSSAGKLLKTNEYLETLFRGTGS